MYTGLPTPDFQAVIASADKAEGFVHHCDQGALMFGQDRREPVATRPVVRVTRHDTRAVVLPCTSKPPSNPADFFELTPQRVMWKRLQADRQTFAYWRYETVANFSLQGMIGMMPQSARIELLYWLRQKI